MFTNEMLYKNACPLVEEFHIRNIMGALERKQWVIGATVTLTAAGVYAADFSTITGGLIDRFDHYQVLAQEINAAPVGWTFADTKTTTSFIVRGDINTTACLIVLGVEPLHPRSTKKWAKDYCPFCKSQDFKAVVGSIFKDTVLLGFMHTQVAGTDTVVFADEVTMKNLTGDFHGQMGGPLVTQMADAAYQIIVTKSSAGAVNTKPYVSARTKVGFDLTAEVGETYDVFVLGQITY